VSSAHIKYKNYRAPLVMRYKVITCTYRMASFMGWGGMRHKTGWSKKVLRKHCLMVSHRRCTQYIWSSISNKASRFCKASSAIYFAV